MGQLMKAVGTGDEPEISAKDNLRTMALIEAAYRAADRHSAVELAEELQVAAQVPGAEALRETS